ncbi:PREDICTED: uncharacterized protein LOC106821347 [Priapulus caudatus]|uniref:Uncharacterized protein LOC106821347 n=1 Tax=Priapulus caudatus TaxID=37621 RepID=A0ABM1FAX7_PRICU|nr:PREDICTED: uncharacterized protein LOC106821347 [Priapulus caudatus]
MVLKIRGFKVKEWVYTESITNESVIKDEGRKPNEMAIIKEAEEQKVLGVVWDPASDEMKYKVKPVHVKDKQILTKRMVLSELARVYDPIGFTAAFLIRGKILMQKLWQRGIDWDDDLQASEKSEWRKFFLELEHLEGVSFPRCLMRKPVPVELVIFCDASEDAFRAVAYTRWEESEGIFGVRFLSAKSRVAPLKCLSIPRLELQAAVIASRLCGTIRKEMSVDFESVVFLSDSIIALSWIRGQSRQYKTFVANRVSEIQSSTDPSE